MLGQADAGGPEAVTEAQAIGQQTTTTGPAARPSRLFASARVPSAVARIDSGVRPVTTTPAAPAGPATKNASRARHANCADPGPMANAVPRNASEASE